MVHLVVVIKVVYCSKNIKNLKLGKFPIAQVTKVTTVSVTWRTESFTLSEKFVNFAEADFSTNFCKPSHVPKRVDASKKKCILKKTKHINLHQNKCSSWNHLAVARTLSVFSCCSGTALVRRIFAGYIAVKSWFHAIPSSRASRAKGEKHISYI